MRKYIFSLILIFSLCCKMAFGQEQVEPKKKNLFGTKYEKPSSGKDFFSQMNFTIKAGASTYINSLPPETKPLAAPSPISFSPAISFIWPNYTFLAVEPAVSFFWGYYQFANGMAIPAEIENRTAATLSFLIDIPAKISFYFQRSKIQLGAGVGILLRFASLAEGVSPGDFGTTGTASGDVSAINSFFWSNARFLYLSASFAWMYDIYKNTKAGPYFAVYFPLGSIFAGEEINGMIASIGLKVSF